MKHRTYEAEMSTERCRAVRKPNSNPSRLPPRQSLSGPARQAGKGNGGTDRRTLMLPRHIYSQRMLDARPASEQQGRKVLMGYDDRVKHGK